MPAVRHSCGDRILSCRPERVLGLPFLSYHGMPCIMAYGLGFEGVPYQSSFSNIKRPETSSRDIFNVRGGGV